MQVMDTGKVTYIPLQFTATTDPIDPLFLHAYSQKGEPK